MISFDWAKEAEKQWDRKAESWNSRSKEMWESGSRKEIPSFFAKHVPAAIKVCDVGCGDGYGTYMLAESGYAVTGVDVSLDMIQMAKEVNKENSASFQKGDLRELSFTDNEYDAVLAINSLEWTEDPKDLLEEIQRIVKHGGYACIGILGPTAGPRENSYQRLYNEKVICNTMMPWEFARLAQENKWEIIDGLPVYKKGVEQLPVKSLALDLQQALTFMWVFMLKNNK